MLNDQCETVERFVVLEHFRYEICGEDADVPEEPVFDRNIDSNLNALVFLVLFQVHVIPLLVGYSVDQLLKSWVFGIFSGGNVDGGIHFLNMSLAYFVLKPDVHTILRTGRLAVLINFGSLTHPNSLSLS